MKVWLLIDVSYLAWRALHSTGHLSHGDLPTGVTFGLLKCFADLRTRFPTAHMVFCFDHGKGLREQKYPWYKETRRKKVLTEEEEEKIVGMKKQINKLRTDYLKEVGFSNVFYQEGYEADDIIAQVVHHLECDRPDDVAYIVSADKDLYQLLRKRVQMYDPKTRKGYTRKMLKADYGVSPSQWVYVKAIAGCLTDDVPGVDGVGEKTACKYLRKELKPGSVAYNNILDQAETWMDNLELVRLPFPGVKQFFPKPDKVDPKALRRITDSLGMFSLRDS